MVVIEKLPLKVFLILPPAEEELRVKKSR